MPKYQCVISLVIYNPNIDVLQKTINSALSTNLKILINIVDNSEQPSLNPKFISQFNKQQINYNYNHGNNIGFGRAHNLTLNQYINETEYFLILNPDIYYQTNPDIVAELKARLDKDITIGLAIPKILSEDNTIQYVNKRLPSPFDLFLRVANKYIKKLNIVFKHRINKYLLQNLDFNKNIICPAISGCFMFIRSDVIKKLGGFDEQYFLYMEDTDLSYRIAMHYKTVVFNDLHITHLWQRGAYKQFNLFIHLIKSGIKYFNKWGWFFDQTRKELNSKISYY